MNYLVNTLVIFSYAYLVYYWWGRASRGIWAPSTFFGLFTIIFGMPIYLLTIENNLYTTETFQETVTLGGFLMAAAMYPAAIIAMAFEKYFTSNRSSFRLTNSRNKLSQENSLKLLLFVAIILTIWIFATPRLGMLKALLGGLRLGDSQELNYLRRVQFNEGFFNQKVFTWLRFALGPILCLICNEALRGHLNKYVRWIASFLVYFLFSAAFHKSTWILGFGFIAINEFLSIKNKKYRSSHLALTIVILSASAGFLLAIAYALQYRSNENLSLTYHLIHGFARMFGCTNDGLFTFTYVFPNRLDFMPKAVFLGPFSGIPEGPERVSALVLGVDTTIQPGVLGSLYSAVGIFCIPAYMLYVLILCGLSNLAIENTKNATARRIFAPCAILGLMWCLHNPLFPAIFSSGLFMALAFTFTYIVITNKQKNTTSNNI